jgi:hypothetical protein
MRGIGKGQTIKLLVIPEIVDRINVQVSIGSGNITKDSDNVHQFLKDIVSWLVINSMRVDGVQFNLLCEQSVANIWRKRCFAMLRKDYATIDDFKASSVQVNRSLQVFRERIDFEIENSIPHSVLYSEKVTKLIVEHKDVLALEVDRLYIFFRL